MRLKHDYLNRDIYTNPGNPKKPTYAPKYAEDGSLELVSTGFVDTDLEISAQRDKTDMSYILARLQAGDPSVMPDPDALYADVTGLPNTPIGMVNFLDGLRRQFDALPAETRALFDNNFNRFVAGVPIADRDPVSDEVDPHLSKPDVVPSIQPSKPGVVAPAETDVKE